MGQPKRKIGITITETFSEKNDVESENTKNQRKQRSASAGLAACSKAVPSKKSTFNCCAESTSCISNSVNFKMFLQKQPEFESELGAAVVLISLQRSIFIEKEIQPQALSDTANWSNIQNFELKPFCKKVDIRTFISKTTRIDLTKVTYKKDNIRTYEECKQGKI